MTLVEPFLQDARRAARGLLRTPGFTLAALLTLALGIGANSAIFTVVNAVLLKPLPYADPDRRVSLYRSPARYGRSWNALAEVQDWRTRTTLLEEVAVWMPGQVNLTGHGEPIRIGAARVSPNTFRVLGASPLLGRAFVDEDAAPGPLTVLIISHGLWQRHYGGDPAIVGRQVLANGVSLRIVGVMPEGFRLPSDFGEAAAEPTEAWAPFYATPEQWAERDSSSAWAAASLKRGVTVAAANAELAALGETLRREGLYEPTSSYRPYAIALRDDIVGGVRPAVLLLTGAVALLLLIACANVAALLLARAEGRQREMAIRAALGAGQARLFGQLFTEGLVLAAASAIAGLGFAAICVRTLLAIDPVAVPRAESLAIDGRVLLFTAAITMVTTLLFSLAPALRTLRRDLIDAVREGSHQGTASRRRQRLRGLLVVSELALAVVLMMGATLMIRSVWFLQRIDLGFDPDRVLTMRLILPESAYGEPAKAAGFYAAFLQRVRALPGVEAAGVVRSLPLANQIGGRGVDVEGYDETDRQGAGGDWQVASDGAIEALGERLVRGRPFRASDTAETMPVALVNEAFARTYFADGEAIGKRFRLGTRTDRPWVTIVGIVGNVRHNGIEQAVRPKFYLPIAQFPRVASGSPMRTVTLVVKTVGDPLTAVAPIRGAIRAIDRDLPIGATRTMREVVGTATATPRFTGWLLTLFAGIALALSAVGIYGLLAYLVSQRRQEIGIRMAMGAEARDVLALVFGRGLVLTMMGVAAGVALASVATRLLASQLRGVAPHDLTTFLVVPGALVIVALAASYLPARRATRVDPLTALRSE